MNVPNLYIADELTCGISSQKGIPMKDGNVQWVAARPMGYQALYLVTRIKLAWKVFIGHYDAVRWIEQDKF